MLFSSRLVHVSLISLVFAALLLGGCSKLEVPGFSPSGNTEKQQEGEQARSFMMKINQLTSQLKDKMALFTEAVTRNDLVSMKTHIQAIDETITQINNLEAPQELADVKSKYSEGCSQLKTALSDFVNLYSDIDTATAKSPFDFGSYASRLAQVQDLYDKAVSALQAADEAATKL